MIQMVTAFAYIPSPTSSTASQNQLKESTIASCTAAPESQIITNAFRKAVFKQIVYNIVFSTIPL